MLQTDLWRIEIDGGSWIGENLGLSQVGEIPSEQAIEVGTVVLTGEGDYEGLSA